MNKSDKKLLRQNRTRLAKELELQEVSQYLIEKEVLTDLMWEKLHKENLTEYNRNAAFLFKLETRGPQALQFFKEALRETEQPELAKLLETSPTQSPVTAGPVYNTPIKESDFSPVYNTPIKESEFGSPNHNSNTTVPKQLYYPDNFENLKSTKPMSAVLKKCAIFNEKENLPENNHKIKCNINNHIFKSTDEHDRPTVESLTVLPSTEEFFKWKQGECYPMSGKNRGYCLIISVEQFNDPTKFPNRNGGEVDRSRVEFLFRQLNYVVYNLINPNAVEMETTLKNFAAWENHRVVDSCTVIIMSHGEDGVVYGRDGNTVCIDSIFEFFSNRNSPYLRNKPKMFFIQACRGNAIDNGIDVSDNPNRNKNQSCSLAKLPHHSDSLIGYATQPGYIAMRNTAEGSWYIQSLVQTFAKHAKDTSLSDMLTIVNSEIKQREGYAPGTEYDGCKEMSTYENMLCKPVYFFPGHAEK